VAGVEPATARRMTGWIGSMLAVGRCRWPGEWAGSTQADDIVGEAASPSSFTRRSAGSAARRSCQARSRVAEPAAGNVAASMARSCPDQTKRWRKYFCPNRLGEPAVRRACTWRDAAPGRRGHCRRAYEATERGPQTPRGRIFTERPRNPDVQAGFKAHVRSRAKCMPVAPQRGHPTRAKRSTFTSKQSKAFNPQLRTEARPPDSREYPSSSVFRNAARSRMPASSSSGFCPA
jgi:hypothetical protein